MRIAPVRSSSLLRLHRNHREAYPDVVDQGVEDVDVRTLAGELGERTFPQPMLLKLDVQSYESEVLEGAGDALSRFRWVVLETSTAPMYEGQVLFDGLVRQLGERDFRFAGPLDIHVGVTGSVCQFDALFARTQP